MRLNKILLQMVTKKADIVMEDAGAIAENRSSDNIGYGTTKAIQKTLNY